MALTKKMAALASIFRLELSVSKEDGPVDTSVEVRSTGDDDASFTDEQLTPGPASMQMSSANSYNIVWAGAFVKKGSATLDVQVFDPSGAVHGTESETVPGEAGEKFVRLVVIP